MARRRKVSFPTMSGGTVSFFVRDEPKNKDMDREKKERAKLKREIVKEVEKLINKKIDGGKIDLFEFEGETNKMIRTTARLAIEMWEKRR